MAAVYKKLMNARIKLQSTQLKKSGVNKFAGFQYFELSDFLPTIQQIFTNEGLCGVVSFDKEIATLTITDVEDLSSISITSPMSEANLKGVHAIQNLGAVQTYLRRYLWVAALEIVEHDALDATNGKDMSASELADWIAAIDETSTADQLKTVFAKAYAASQSDLDAQKKIVAAKDKKKASL